MPAYTPQTYQSVGGSGGSEENAVAPFAPIGPIGPNRTGPQIFVQNTTPFGSIPVNSLWFDTSPITY